ncbi:MAG: rRNA maturation RNase YbeY [bacterium]|nr:rRNA maturation RNase YbeY [bacterium]
MRMLYYRVERILEACCKTVNLPRSRVEFSVNIFSPATMRKLNKTHRGKDKATDVLSFPLLTRGEVSTLKKKRGILAIGDIFINRLDAKKRLPFLVVHGFLHLMGYDHERSKHAEKIMFSLQDEIISHLRD